MVPYLNQPTVQAVLGVRPTKWTMVRAMMDGSPTTEPGTDGEYPSLFADREHSLFEKGGVAVYH